ncbi:MAG: hypothetical protein DRP45_06880 [Candidatus Zixiibacteriota bacterium]|nr:MAG: hypothetical protein DRP45_06880 [candidate division Zixibacteria bacterium]
MKQEVHTVLDRFQVEPVPSCEEGMADSRRLATWLDSNHTRPAIESLLLGLQHRNWLSSREKELLEVLAPERTTIFLARENRYLHPRQSKFFSTDLLEMAEAPDGEALYSHHYLSSTNDGPVPCRVHTAMIGSLESQGFILGLLCPEKILDDGNAEWFADIVQRFRKAWQVAQKASEALSLHYDEKKPALVVNRASGITLMVSESLARLVETDPGELVGQEYSVIARKLSTSTSGYKLHLKNLQPTGMQLCVASFQPTSRTVPNTPFDQFFSKFAFHTMRNKLSAIMVAASHLDTLRQTSRATNESELTEIILGEATRLDRHIDRLHLLVDCNRLPLKLTLLDRDLKQAIRLLNDTYRTPPDIEVITSGKRLEVEAPLNGIVLLLEAVLLSHINRRTRKCRTVVRVTENTDMITVEVDTGPTKQDAELGFDKLLHEYSTRLADQMKIAIEQFVLSDQNTLRSQLQIRKGKSL